MRKKVFSKRAASLFFAGILAVSALSACGSSSSGADSTDSADAASSGTDEEGFGGKGMMGGPG